MKYSAVVNRTSVRSVRSVAQREVNKAVPDGQLKIFEGFRGMIHIFQAKACALEALRFWNDVDSGKKVRE